MKAKAKKEGKAYMPEVKKGTTAGSDPKPWESGWVGSDEEWNEQMESHRSRVEKNRELFERHFALMTFHPDDVHGQTTKHVDLATDDHVLPVFCFFGEIKEEAADMLLTGGKPVLSRHREFEENWLPTNSGRVPSAFPHEEGSKYNMANLPLIVRSHGRGISHDRQVRTPLARGWRANQGCSRAPSILTCFTLPYSLHKNMFAHLTRSFSVRPPPALPSHTAPSALRPLLRSARFTTSTRSQPSRTTSLCARSSTVTANFRPTSTPSSATIPSAWTCTAARLSRTKKLTRHQAAASLTRNA